MKTKIIKEHGTRNRVGIYIDTYQTSNSDNLGIGGIYDSMALNNVRGSGPPYVQHIVFHTEIECCSSAAPRMALLNTFVEIVNDATRDPSLHINDIIVLQVSANIYDYTIDTLKTLSNMDKCTIVEVAESATHSDFIA